MINAKSLVRYLVLLLLLMSISSCTKDRSLSPPPEGEKVSLIVKVPEGLEVKPMRVMYRSAICRHLTNDAHGRRETLDGYNGFELTLRRSQNDLYEAELNVDGGGACKWRLSNVDFGVQYRLPTPFGTDAISGWGGGLIIVFDSNNPQRRVSSAIAVEGPKLDIVADFYPLVTERFINGYIKYASLVGVDARDLTYNAPQARKIYFEPVLHRDYVVQCIEPKKTYLVSFRSFTTRMEPLSPIGDLRLTLKKCKKFA